jgi:hypothetical protein
VDKEQRQTAEQERVREKQLPVRRKQLRSKNSCEP